MDLLPTSAIADYQAQLKEKDQIIGQLQAENLTLKLSAEKGCQLLHDLIHCLRMAGASVPATAILYLGSNPTPRSPMRVSASLSQAQVEAAYRQGAGYDCEKF